MGFVGEDENFPPTETELNIFFVGMFLLVLLLLVLLLLVLLVVVVVLSIRRGAFCADMDVAWDVVNPP